MSIPTDEQHNQECREVSLGVSSLQSETFKIRQDLEQLEKLKDQQQQSLSSNNNSDTPSNTNSNPFGSSLSEQQRQQQTQLTESLRQRIDRSIARVSELQKHLTRIREQLALAQAQSNSNSNSQVGNVLKPEQKAARKALYKKVSDSLAAAAKELETQIQKYIEVTSGATITVQSSNIKDSNLNTAVVTPMSTANTPSRASTGSTTMINPLTGQRSSSSTGSTTEPSSSSVTSLGAGSIPQNRSINISQSSSSSSQMQQSSSQTTGFNPNYPQTTTVTSSNLSHSAFGPPLTVLQSQSNRLQNSNSKRPGHNINFSINPLTGSVSNSNGGLGSLNDIDVGLDYAELSSGSGPSDPFGRQTQQNSSEAEQRKSSALAKISEKFSELHSVYVDLAEQVSNQGNVLSSIEHESLNGLEDSTRAALNEVKTTAERRYRDAGRKLIMIAGVGAVMVWTFLM